MTCGGKAARITHHRMRVPSVESQQTIHVSQLRATINVHIHYSLDAGGGAAAVTRWLVLDTSGFPKRD
jgi:hypothetical protein